VVHSLNRHGGSPSASRGLWWPPLYLERSRRHILDIWKPHPGGPGTAKEGTEEDRLLIEDWNRNGGSWHRRRSRASPNSRPLVALLVHTGLRRGEALAPQ
jgi:hypothetical protein